jgi:hypothetical protein
VLQKIVVSKRESISYTDRTRFSVFDFAVLAVGFSLFDIAVSAVVVTFLKIGYYASCWSTIFSKKLYADFLPCGSLTVTVTICEPMS